MSIVCLCDLWSFYVQSLSCLLLLVFCVVCVISRRRSNNWCAVQPLLPRASRGLWRNHDREIIIVASACHTFTSIYSFRVTT